MRLSCIVYVRVFGDLVVDESVGYRRTSVRLGVLVGVSNSMINDVSTSTSGDVACWVPQGTDRRRYTNHNTAPPLEVTTKILAI